MVSVLLNRLLMYYIFVSVYYTVKIAVERKFVCRRGVVQRHFYVARTRRLQSISRE